MRGEPLDHLSRRTDITHENGGCSHEKVSLKFRYSQRFRYHVGRRVHGIYGARASAGAICGADTRAMATSKPRPLSRVRYRARHAQMQPLGLRGVPPTILFWETAAKAKCAEMNSRKNRKGKRGRAALRCHPNIDFTDAAENRL
jgi:hypothetical protein